MKILTLAICLSLGTAAGMAHAQSAPSRLTETRPSSATEATDSNPEMRAIFAADQADRKPGGSMNWPEVSARDRARKARVRELLDQGQLKTGDDFYSAAFVLQHGDASNDFLLAHALAMAAQAKGRSDAAWIAAATLDRFLQKLDRPQIFGTQFVRAPGEPIGQGAYDRELISDSLREVLRVPVLEKQAEQVTRMEASRSARDRDGSK